VIASTAECSSTSRVKMQMPLIVCNVNKLLGPDLTS
jgi:hypothetical protein